MLLPIYLLSTKFDDTFTHLFRFPTADKARREEWIKAVGRDGWEPSRSSVLCCNHFEMSQFRVPPGLSRRAMLKVDAVPTKFSKKASYIIS